MQVYGSNREGADETKSLFERSRDSSPVAPATATPPAAAVAADADVDCTAAVPRAAVELEADADLHGSALQGNFTCSSALQTPEGASPTAIHPHAVAPCRHSCALLYSGKGSSPVKGESPARVVVSFEHQVTVSAAALAASKPAIAAAANQAAGIAAAEEPATANEGSLAGAESVEVTANALIEAAAIAAKTASSAAEASAAAGAAEQSGADALEATPGKAAAAATRAADALEATPGKAAAAATRAVPVTGVIAAASRDSATGELATQPPANEAIFSSAAATSSPPSSECGMYPGEAEQREMASVKSSSSSSSSSNSRSCCSYEDEAVLAAAALALELETDFPDVSAAAAAAAAGLTDAAAAAAAAAEVTNAAASAGRPRDRRSLERELEGLLGEAGAAAAADLMALAYQRQAPGDPRDRESANSSGSRNPEAAAKAATTAVALAAAKALEHHRARHPVASSANETNQQLHQRQHQQQEPQRQESRQHLLEKQMECLRLLLLTGCLNPRWKTYTNPQAFQFHFALLLSASVEPLFDVYLKSVFEPLRKETSSTKISQDSHETSAAGANQHQQTPGLALTLHPRENLRRLDDAAHMQSSSANISDSSMQLAFDRGIPLEPPDEASDEAAAARMRSSEGLSNISKRAVAAVCTSLEFVYEACRNLEVINSRSDLSPPSVAQGAAAAVEPQRNVPQVDSPKQVDSAGAEGLMTRIARIAAREAATPGQAAQAQLLVRSQAPDFEKSNLRQEQELLLQEDSEGGPNALKEEPSNSSSSSCSSSSSDRNRQGHLIRTLETFLSSRRLKKRPGGAIGLDEAVDSRKRWSSYPASAATGGSAARKGTRGIRGKRRHTDATATATATSANDQQQSDAALAAARVSGADSTSMEPPGVDSPPPQTPLKRPSSSGGSDILWDPEATQRARSPYPAAAEGQEGKWRLKTRGLEGPPTPSLTDSPGIGSLLLPGEAASSQTASEEGGPVPRIRHGYVARTPEKPPQQPQHQPTTGAGHGLHPTGLQQQRQQPQQHEPTDEEASQAGPGEASDEDEGSPPQFGQPSRAERQQQQQQQHQGSVQITRSGRRVTFAFRVSDLINDEEQPPSPEGTKAAPAREADTRGRHRPGKS
ncbi:hypothetical protein Esti_000753 [Eimeria stiedai]